MHPIFEAGILEGVQRQLDVRCFIFHEKNLPNSAPPLLRKQRRDRGLERARQLLDIGQRQIARTALNIGDVSSMESGTARQLLLGNAELFAPSPDRSAELRFDIR